MCETYSVSAALCLDAGKPSRMIAPEIDASPGAHSRTASEISWDTASNSVLTTITSQYAPEVQGPVDASIACPWNASGWIQQTIGVYARH